MIKQYLIKRSPGFGQIWIKWEYNQRGEVCIEIHGQTYSDGNTGALKTMLENRAEIICDADASFEQYMKVSHKSVPERKSGTEDREAAGVQDRGYKMTLHLKRVVSCASEAVDLFNKYLRLPRPELPRLISRVTI